VQQAFARLEDAGIPFCILRNRDRIPAGLVGGSDVDLVLPPEMPRQRLIEALADLRPVQIVPHWSTIEVYLPAGSHFLHLDLLVSDRQWRGARYLENHAILAQQGDEDGMPAASRLHQAFCAWFSSLTRRKHFKVRYIPLISEATAEQPDAMRGLLHDAFGRRLGDQLLEWSRDGKLDQCDALAGRCRRAIWWRALLRRPFGTMLGLLRHYGAEVAQYMRPAGLTVAVLGPDGAGKSAVCAALANLSRASLPFKQVETRHLYRRVLPLLSELWKGRLRTTPAAPATVHNPHGKRPHRSLVSLFTLTYGAVDQWLSWLLCTRWKLSQNALLLHDRHMLEVQIDPKRFRFAGPKWLARWITRLIPKPDLVIVLDAPAEVLQSRKQEVPLAETARQLDAYRTLTREMPGGRIIDATQPLEGVVNDVKRAIIEFAAARTSRRFPEVGCCASSSPESAGRARTEYVARLEQVTQSHRTFTPEVGR
jgi:thymidylate kinase